VIAESVKNLKNLNIIRERDMQKQGIIRKKPGYQLWRMVLSTKLRYGTEALAKVVAQGKSLYSVDNEICRMLTMFPSFSKRAKEGCDRGNEVGFSKELALSRLAAVNYPAFAATVTAFFVILQ